MSTMIVPAGIPAAAMHRCQALQRRRADSMGAEQKQAYATHKKNKKDACDGIRTHAGDTPIAT